MISPARSIEREDEDLRSLLGIAVICVLYAAASYLFNGGV